jgi:SAM-dependent methyltransferase
VIGDLHNKFVFGRRTEVLRRHIAELIPQNGTVLDVGCGDGSIDKLILASRPDISIRGIDILVRDSVQIPVSRYDGRSFPYPDKSFDTVIFVDVLHHTEEPMVLLKEACRVGRKSIIIKDHNRDGFAAAPILRFMDWIGNAPHGVVLTYNYWSQSRWQSAFEELGLSVDEYCTRLGLYPAPASWVFERGLHFVSRLEVPY